MQKNETEKLLHHSQKLTQNGLKTLIISPEAIKILEEGLPLWLW